VNITTSDPHPDKTLTGAQITATPGQEDGTVQYNAIAHQSWDLESFDLTGSMLSLNGGFDFLTGKGNGTSTRFPQGDIFVYFGQQPYSTPSPWAGANDWDFAVHFVRDGNQNFMLTEEGCVLYQILGGGTTQYTGGTGALNPGLPWMVGNGQGAAMMKAEYNEWVDGGNDWHNGVSGIDIQSILTAAGGEDVYFHTTMKCGNDVLWGFVPGHTVPDGGATAVLLGVGILGVCASRRRMG
jgi:hypothetical protein